MVPHNRVVLTKDEKDAVLRVLDSGMIAQGNEVEAFEEELAARFRPGEFAACVSSGTVALKLAATALSLRQVALPTYACVALYHAIKGLGISLLDCDVPSLNTPTATIVVGTYGMPCDVLGAIEDFTHSAGAMLHGRPCGSFGKASVISFGATKPLGCGTGGAVLGSEDLIDQIKDMRDYDGKQYMATRFNWQMSDIIAALGRSRLRRLDDDISLRAQIGARYWTICQDKGLTVQATGSNALKFSWYRFVVWVQSPEKARAHFRQHGVEVINPLQPGELIHRQIGLDGRAFPNAEKAAAATISLPIWPGLLKAEEDKVVSALEHLKVAA